jgi:hypothetical protein
MAWDSSLRSLSSQACQVAEQSCHLEWQRTETYGDASYVGCSQQAGAVGRNGGER